MDKPIEFVLIDLPNYRYSFICSGDVKIGCTKKLLNLYICLTENSA